MSILSDKQIRSLCLKPLSVITFRNSTFLSTMSADVINDFNSKQGVSPDDVLKYPTMGKFIMQRRDPTEKEISNWKPMISPFVNGQVRKQRRSPTLMELIKFEEARNGGPVPENYVSDNLDIGLEIEEKIISYGLSSFGYDVRLADEFKVFTNINSSIIDPLSFDSKCLVDLKGSYCIIPPNSYVLGRTIEEFNIPRDVQVICLGKSTYARCGAIVNVTPIEAGFSGPIVIEISNSTSLPLKIYANMGISQFVFFQGNEPCEVSYADRDGKYQNQSGIQTALV